MKRSILLRLMITASLLVLALSVAASGISFQDNSAQAQQSGAPKVDLVKKIYDFTDIPYWLGHGVPFTNAEWLSGGYFVVSGSCGVAEPPGSTLISARGASNNINFQGGQYTFREDGSFVARNNVCHDGDLPGTGLVPPAPLRCAEGFGCDVSNKILPFGAASFVREMGAAGLNRPPLAYQIGSSGIGTPKKPYNGIHAIPMPADTQHIKDLAVVGSKVFGIKEIYGSGGNLSGRRNFVASLPNFTVLEEWSADVVPVIGVGNYIVGRSAVNPLGSPAKVYKIDSDNNLQEVQTLPANIGYPFPGFARYQAKDAKNPNRVAFLKIEGGGSISRTLVIYEAGTSGLTQVGTLTLTDGQDSTPLFTVSGDYVAYSQAGRLGQFKVQKGSGPAAVVNLPVATSLIGGDGVQRIQVLQLSANGTLLAGTRENVYLYKLDGIASAAPDPCNINPFGAGCSGGGAVPPTTAQIPGQNFSISYSTSSVLNAPDVLIQMSQVTAVYPVGLQISIFGRVYTVNTAGAEILGSSWTPIPLSSFVPGGFANVWGTLDANEPAVIRAKRVRNPLPAGITPPAGGGGSLDPLTPNAGQSILSPQQAPSTATQSQLNILQQALDALKARLGQ